MKLGTNDIGSVYLGTNAVSSVYLGSNLVWSGMDADYKAVLDYATTQGYTLPSASQQLLQEQLIIDLKDAGVWSKLDTFAVFATDAEDSSGSGTSNFALIDWKRLTQYDAVNTPTFSVNGGFTGNGTSSYIDTNFNPSTSGVNYTLNDAGRYFWVNSYPNFTIWEGTDTTNVNFSAPRNSANSVKINQGITNTSTSINFSQPGSNWRSINRTTSTDITAFYNLTSLSTTATSSSIQNSNQFILRGGSIFTTASFALYAMGASLVSENSDFYNAVNTYITSL
jgi:hypothetical protein